MPPIPDAPTDLLTFLWIALAVWVSGSTSVIVYLWRLYQKLRDQREKDLKDLLAKEKAEAEKQQALLDRNTNTLDSILQALTQRRTK